MGFGILTVDTLIVNDVMRSDSEDVLRDALKIPSVFVLAHGPYHGSRPHSANWILHSDLIPKLSDEPFMPQVVPVYSRRIDDSGASYTTIDRVEIRSGADYRLLTALACAVPLPEQMSA